MAIPLDEHPIIVAIAETQWAGKTTFYHAHIRPAGLRFVNADVFPTRELNLDPYSGARPGRLLSPGVGTDARELRV